MSYSHNMSLQKHHVDCQCVRCKPNERPCNCSECIKYKENCLKEKIMTTTLTVDSTDAVLAIKHQEKYENLPDVKITPAHLPAGTVIIVHVKSMFDSKPEVRTVKHLVKNSVFETIVVCLEYNELIQTEYSYHIEHVVKIVKRGRGPVVFQKRDLPVVRYTNDPNRMSSVQINVKANLYQALTIVPLVNSVLTKKQLERSDEIDYPLLEQLLLKQKIVTVRHFTDSESYENGMVWYFEAKKTNLKKATQRLFNKSLKPYKLIAKELKDYWEDPVFD